MSRLHNIQGYPRLLVSVLSVGGTSYSSTLGGGSSFPPFSKVESTSVSSFGVNTSFSQENTHTVIPITNAGTPSFFAKFMIIKFELCQMHSLCTWKDELPSQPGSGMSSPCISTLPNRKICAETSFPLVCYSCTSKSISELTLEQRKSENKEIRKKYVDLYVQIMDNAVQHSFTAMISMVSRKLKKVDFYKN